MCNFVDNRTEIPAYTRSRAWIFTINNYTDDDISSCKTLGESITDKEYMVYGLEVGESGTPHIQGYVKFTNARSRGKMSKILKRASFRIAKGTDAQNQKYCCKDGNYKEYGKIPKQGKRTDLDHIVNLIRTGNEKNINNLLDINPSLVTRNYRNIKEIIKSNFKPRDSPPRVTWIYGSTGVGKTRWVMEAHGRDNVYIKDITKWWCDQYTQQEAILIDDFNGRWPFRDLLRLLDEYRYIGQTKGGHVEINSPYIYITCDRTPKAVYYNSLNNHEYSQLKRRITEIIYIDENHIEHEGIDGADIEIFNDDELDDIYKNKIDVNAIWN